VIADGAHLDGGDVACAFGVDAFHRLFTERFALRLLEGNSDDAPRRAADADTAATTSSRSDFAPLNRDGLGRSARLGLGHGFGYGLFIERFAVEDHAGRSLPAVGHGEGGRPWGREGAPKRARSHKGVAA